MFLFSLLKVTNSTDDNAFGYADIFMAAIVITYIAFVLLFFYRKIA